MGNVGRRGFLLGLLAAPAIVRASSLMSIRPPPPIVEPKGIIWTATRFNRLPLPFAPLSEGIPPFDVALTIDREVLPLAQRRLADYQFGQRARRLRF